MYSLIYKSIGKPEFDSAAIFKMLLKAKRFNADNDISGCIIFYKGIFIQLLEGQKAKVEALYDNIKADDRHRDITTLIKTPADKRLWEDWSMAFYDLSGSDKSVTQKRALLEIYFDTANTESGSNEVFSVFKHSIYELLNE